MTAIFITATGPDVGKTFVVASLVRHLQQIGHAVDAIKPIVSGYEPAQAASKRSGELIAAFGLPFSPEIDRAHVALAFSRCAAARSRRAIREAAASTSIDVIAYCQTADRRRRGVLLIEGVGGIMAPLDDRTAPSST